MLSVLFFLNHRMAGNSSSGEGGLSLNRQRIGHGSSTSAASRLATAITSSSSNIGRSRAMAASLVALSARGLPPLPASMVPEPLIQQVQTVLSGSKSRQLIVRELQRTHLDVNLAVNNLLSRDSDGEGDDDDDDMGESSADASDVARFLDAATSASGLVEHLLMDDDDDVHLVNRGASHDHMRRAAAAFFDSPAEDSYPLVRKSSSKPMISTNDALRFDKELVYWLNDDGTPATFTSIGSMHSELVGIDINGHLQSWPWKETKSPSISKDGHGHPRSRSLGLTSNDKVIQLSCSSSRASLVTDSMRIASWLDNSIRQSQTTILEHSAILFPQLTSLSIKKINVSDTQTAVLTTAGSIYWWGALPYGLRCSQTQQPPPSKATAPSVTRASNWPTEAPQSKQPESTNSSIVPGVTVRLKMSPLVSCGALALAVPSSNLQGVELAPRLAELQEDAWNPTSSYKFKLLPTNSFIPTISNKRKRASGVSANENSPNVQETSDEVSWPLSQVILLNDGPSPPLGRVVKVDGDYAAVRFQNGQSQGGTGNNSPATQADIETLLADCRLLRLSELEVVGGTISAMSSKQRHGAAPSIQVTPKRLDNLAEPGQILGWMLSSDLPGPTCHLITRRSEGLFYRTVPILSGRTKHYRKRSGKQESSKHKGYLIRFPISSCLFNDPASEFRLLSPSQSNSSVLFAVDQHFCVFPICRPPTNVVTSSFCEIPSLKLPPAMAFFGGFTPNPRLSSPPFFVAVFSFQLPLLSTCINRRDLSGLRRCLNYFEQLEDNGYQFSNLLQQEKGDGGRNIIHMAIENCALSSHLSSSSRRNSFDENNDFELHNYGDSGASGGGSRHRVAARRLTLRQMIREASSAASSNTSNTGGGNNRSSQSGSNTGSGGSSSQNWPQQNDNTAIITVNAAADDSNSNQPDNLGDLVKQFANPYYFSGKGEDSSSRKDSEETILIELMRSKVVQPHFHKLLTAVDANSRTPFMVAIQNRTYSAAIQILQAVLQFHKSDPSFKDESLPFRVLEPYLFPTRYANADDNPFHVLCFNDTCSYTWTGSEHINQDIYECRPCGLVDSLCCCSECARVCHRGPGHDCRLKRTSPTAYCDCWEKCSCKTLSGGNQSDRLQLAKELSRICPHLLMLPTAASLGRPKESILAFLLRTLQRQQLEQRQYRGPPARSSGIRRSHGYRSQHHSSGHPDNCEPPRFVRQVLNFILESPTLLGNILTCLGDTALTPFGGGHDQQHSYICELDKVAFLVLKCSSDVHDRFSKAIVELDKKGASEAVGAFIRSVVRAFSAIAASLPPHLALPPSRSSSHSSASVGCMAALPLRGCKQILASVPLISIRELASAASAIIRPVTLGMCRNNLPNYNIISPMMMTSLVSEAVDAAENILLGTSSGGQMSDRLSRLDSRRKSRFHSAIFGIRRNMESTGEDDNVEMMDPVVNFDIDTANSGDDDDNEFNSDDENEESDGDSDDRPDFPVVLLEQMMEFDDDEEVEGEENEANQPVSPDFVDAVEENFQEIQQIELPPPLLPRSVGPSSSASSVSGLNPQNATEANEQQDETVSLIRSAAATAGSEAGGTSIISYASEEDDVDSAAGSSTQHRGSIGSSYNNPAINRFRRRLQSSSSSSSHSDSNEDLVNSGDLGLIAPMRPAQQQQQQQQQDDVSNDSSVTSQSRLRSAVAQAVSVSTAQHPPPPPPLPPPPPPVSNVAAQNEPYRYIANDVSAFLSSETSHASRRNEMRAHSPSIFHSGTATATQATSSGGTTSSNANVLSSLGVANPSNDVFNSANQQHLTRLFSIMVRFAADLIGSLAPNSQNSSSQNSFQNSFLSSNSKQQQLNIPIVSAAQLRNLQDDVDTILEPAFRWIIAAVDSVEAQLRCRQNHQQNHQGDNLQSGSKRHGKSRDSLITSARQSFGHHALNLIRDPHGFLPDPDFLPVLRYAIDSLLSTIKACTNGNTSYSTSLSREIERGSRLSSRMLGYVEVSDDSDDSLPTGNLSFRHNLDRGATYSANPVLLSWNQIRTDLSTQSSSSLKIDHNHPFFRRTPSLTAVGWEAPPTFSTSGEDALPLASRPDMLGPNSRRPELFGLRRQSGLTNSGLLAEFPSEPFSSIGQSATQILEQEQQDSSTKQLRRPRVGGSELSEQVLAARWALVLNCVASLRQDGQAVDSSYTPGGELFGAGGASDPMFFSRFLSSPSFDPLASFSGIPSWGSNSYTTSSMVSPVNELVGGFTLVERRFRSEMDRLRNSQQREISMTDLERNPTSQLLFCVARQLQNAFARRANQSQSALTRPHLGHSSSSGCPPLMCHKLKVAFLHEPGEGAGVTRSLFTSFAEEIQKDECTLPVQNLRSLIGNDSSNSRNQSQPSSSSTSSSQQNLIPPQAHQSRNRNTAIFSSLIPAFFSVPLPRPGGGSSSNRDWSRILQDAVSVAILSARNPDQPRDQFVAIPEFAPNNADMQARFPSHKLRFGVRLLSRINAMENRLAGRIVYVLLHLTPNQLLQLLTSENRLREIVAETALLINEASASGLSQHQQQHQDTSVDELDTEPLFYRLSNGYLAPRVGRGSTERLIALRCVGRVIGLALLHGELCPFLLARHVIGYIIGKVPFCFHDLAFLDTVAFDSLRRIAQDVTTLPPEEAKNLCEAIDLTALVDLLPEEGGGRVELALPGQQSENEEAEIPSGGQPITPDNALAFVMAYSELRLVHVARPALDAMRAGVLDVLPNHVLEQLTPEDALLLLCGTGTKRAMEPLAQQRVVDRLKNLTTIQNESGRDADMVRRFKGWFWAEVSRLARVKNQPSDPSTSQQPQDAADSNAIADLLSFWTGSSALPATDNALISTPPSLVVRPPDDMHLPTANTCISR